MSCISTITIIFLINWVDDDGVNVDVGRDVLNVVVPVNALLFDWTADNVVFPVNWVVKLLNPNIEYFQYYFIESLINNTL